MLMDACYMVGVVVNDIAHVMMPAFVAAMLVVVYSQFIINDLPGAAPAGAFALVFAFLARGAPARKPLDSLKVKLIGTTELTLSAYHFGAILAGHAQAMQPFCALFMLVALALHVVIGDIEGCPLIGGLAMGHICLGLFWKVKDEVKKP